MNGCVSARGKIAVSPAIQQASAGFRKRDFTAATINDVPDLGRAERTPVMKRFKIQLNIGISGEVAADHYEVSDGVVRFYDPKISGAPVAVYALASVCSVQVVGQERRENRMDYYQPKGGFDPWYLSSTRHRSGGSNS
jgi:hypothetical protein